MDYAFLADQAAMLGLFAPSGMVPAVLAVDAAAGAVLLESIAPIIAINRIGNPAYEQAVAELLTLSR